MGAADGGVVVVAAAAAEGLVVVGHQSMEYREAAA